MRKPYRTPGNDALSVATDKNLDVLAAALVQGDVTHLAMRRGSVTLAGTSQAVTFSPPFGEAPTVFLQEQANITAWPSAVAAGGFTLNTSAAGTVQYLAIGRGSA